MKMILPLIGLVCGAFFTYQASTQFSVVNPAITSTAVQPPAPATPPPPKAQAEEDRRGDVPPYKALIRCLGDLDDLLDMVVDRNSFEALKPRLLKRVHLQVVYAKEHSNQGMGRLSRAAAKELQTAVNRHAQAVMRANEAAPGVKQFFETKVAAMLKGD